MKEIKAVIQPARLARLREAFRGMPDFPGMTVTKSEGSGYHPGKPHAPGIKGELTEYSAKIRIEMVVPDEKVDAILRVIYEQCHTGRAGDGVYWVTPVESFRRIREPEGAE
jgi:nitrogen regulatory protein P-II 1